jgi:hypothetical protein
VVDLSGSDGGEAVLAWYAFDTNVTRAAVYTP